ncbi:hypothetical protein [Nocardia sp. SC052]|uniref:hypothetical protein n=1 Tax=Nocardia sichangensis TaxID=3385975 RepID=UPI00399FAEEA
MGGSRADLLSEVPDAAELAATDAVLVELLVRLSRQLWQRGDRQAVDVLTLCLVDLPVAVLLRRDRPAGSRTGIPAQRRAGRTRRRSPHPFDPCFHHSLHLAMAALIQVELTPKSAVASMTTGRRFGGVDAAVALPAPLGGKDPGTLGAIENTMYAAAVTALTT